MAQYTRTRRINLNASPNQIESAPTGAGVISLVGYTVSNYNNSSDSWIHFYNDTSGTVSVGTTEQKYGPLLIPAGGQIVNKDGTEQSPLAFFTGGMTIAATTTENGSTSPTNQLSFELHYYK